MTRGFFVGISGGSGSGKTTVARAVLAMLGEACCTHIEHDCYYRDLAHLPLAERRRVNFDHPEALDNALLREHVEALRDGRPVPRLRYDFATHTRTAAVDEVPVRPVVLVDGILLLSIPELRECLDLRVFVDAPPDIRFIRRLRRDLSERGRDPHHVCEQYLASVRPMHEQFVEPSRQHADLLLSGTGPVADTMVALRAAIESRPGGGNGNHNGISR